MSTSAGWDRTREIFQAALDKSPAEREAFVRTACDSDETLRREVSSLLAAHAAAGGFLEVPAVRLQDVAAPLSGETVRPSSHRTCSFARPKSSSITRPDV